jgi:hypothetical protein
MNEVIEYTTVQLIRTRIRTKKLFNYKVFNLLKKDAGEKSIGQNSGIYNLYGLLKSC